MIIKQEFRTCPAWVHMELINWARWCWQGQYPHPPDAICKSIERNYSRVSEEGTTDDARPIAPNEHNARIVQAVWERLPRVPRMVLRAEYPQRHAVRPKISGEAYKAHLSYAMRRVMIAFERGL